MTIPPKGYRLNTAEVLPDAACQHRPARFYRNALVRASKSKRTAIAIPYDKSGLILVTARIRYVAESEWGSRRYEDVALLEARVPEDGSGAVGKFARIMTVQWVLDCAARFAAP